MDCDTAKRLILSYVEGWKEGDREKILGSLDPECVIIESYGPTYRGATKVGRWIDSWFGPGNEVNRWDVTSLYVTGEACFFEWVFECTFARNRDGFEGASIAQFRNEKIVFLREYAMTAKRYEWEG
jgi:hypothetical protein